MSLEDQLKNPEYRNWVRATLGLKFLKDGLTPFVAEQANELLTAFNPSSLQCGVCDRKTLQPKHVSAKTNCPHGSKCSCMARNKNPCPQGICSEMYDLIVERYNGFIPHSGTTEIKQLSWSNTDTTQWTKDPWEVAKCYIHSSGYKDKHSAAECDASGLLTICINCKTIRSKITPVNFEEARERRNVILHTSTFRVKDTELASTIDIMLDVLKEKEIVMIPCAQKAITDLEELKNDRKIIDRVESLEARTAAVEALTQQIQELENAIADVQEGTDTCENERQKLTTELSEFKQVLDTHQTCIREIKDTQKQIEERIEVLEKERQTHRTVALPVKLAFKFFNYDTGLQRYLVDTYKEKYLDVNVSPLLPKVKHIDEMFIPLNLMEKLKGGVDRRNEIRTFKDLFYNEEGKLRTMFIAADAGMGKTTLCTKLVSTWCKAFDTVFRRTGTRTMSETRDFKLEEEQWRETEKQNIKFMKKYQYVFFVSLRRVIPGASVEEMVEQQLLSHTNHVGMFRYIIETYPHLCLFILDGLDEWKHAHMQQENPILSESRGLPFETHFCTTLYTTRPWKLSEIVVRDNKREKKVELDGLTNTSSMWLVYKMLLNLKEDNATQPLPYSDFFDELQAKRIEHFGNIPIMLKLLVCLWFEHRHLSEKITVIYCDALNLVLKHYLKMKAGLNQVGDNTENTRLPGILRKDECAKFNDLLLALCQFAHTTYNNNDSLVFMADQLHLHGMRREDVQICLESGLLSKTAIDKGIIDLHVQVSYIHKTFQEFFVAVHLATKPDQLSELLANCNTYESVAEQFVVLRFVCGLENKAVQTIAEHIYTNMSRDDWETYKPDSDKVIQNTVFSFIKESQQTEERSVPLNQVQIQDKDELKMVKYVDPATVKILFCAAQMPEIDYLIQMSGLVRVKLEKCILREQGTCIALCSALKSCALTLTNLTIDNEDELHLTHSQVSTLLCLPELSHLNMSGVQCHSDKECGCDTEGLKSVSIVNSTGTMHVKNCSLTNTSQVLCHVLDAPELETLRLIDSGNDLHISALKSCARTLTNLTINSKDELHLTHSQVSTLLCLPELSHVTMSGVHCHSDIECGCDNEGLQRDSIVNSTGTMHAKYCRLTNTSQVLCHVVNAPELETLFVTNSDDKPNTLHRIIQTCKRIQWVHIDNLSINDVNIQFSPRIRSLRIVQLKQVGIQAATLKSLIQSVPSKHPGVCIELERADIVEDAQSSWLRQTWNTTSGFVDYQRIVVNKMM